MSNLEISEWFYQYNKDIYHYLVYYTGLSDIDDLVQEVFIRAIKGMDSFQGKSSPKTWLISIARNVGIDEVRKRKRREVINKVTFKHEQSIIEERTPEKMFQINETNKYLYLAIQSLKPTYRDVIILRAIKELSVEETADVLHWNINKVRVTFHRALKALQKEKERFSL